MPAPRVMTALLVAHAVLDKRSLVQGTTDMAEDMTTVIQDRLMSDAHLSASGVSEAPTAMES